MSSNQAMIHVLRPGLFTTVQDGGRPGFRRFGVSVSGALDRWAITVGNRLLGNSDDAAGLEITLQGPELLFEQATLIAITGADLTPLHNASTLPMWTVIDMPAGARLEFGRRRTGARAYLTVAGGIEGSQVLGSHSTHVRSGLGGFHGRALTKWDQLPVGRMRSETSKRVGLSVPLGKRPHYSVPPTLRILPGPQIEQFVEHDLGALVEHSYRVTTESDRMGYRLSGPPLHPRVGADTISDAVTFGAIQVPPDGQPILLMADCQTTGGYAKPAVVVTVDLPSAAQLLPGDSVRFRFVSPDDASHLLRTMRAELDRLLPPCLG